MSKLKSGVQSAASGVQKVGSQVGGAAKGFANQGWSAIPMPVKGILFLAVGYGIYKLVKGGFKGSRLSGPGRDTQQEVDGWNQSFIRDNAQQKATMSGAQMKAAANAIFTAMDGWGTDDPGVINQFKKVKNNADYSGLSAAWGRRTISSGRFNPEPNLANATLIQALASEMDGGEKGDINKILSKAGVKYRI